MYHVNIYTDQKTANWRYSEAYRRKRDARITWWWHARLMRMTQGRVRYVLKHPYSYLRMRLRKARGYYAHTARRIQARLTQKPVRPYVRCYLLTDMLL